MGVKTSGFLSQMFLTVYFLLSYCLLGHLAKQLFLCVTVLPHSVKWDS